MKLKEKVKNEFTDYKVVATHNESNIGFYGYSKDMTLVRLQKYNNNFFIPVAIVFSIGYITFTGISLLYSLNNSLSIIMFFFLSASYSAVFFSFLLYFIDVKATKIEDERMSQSLKRVIALDFGDLEFSESLSFKFENSMDDNLRLALCCYSKEDKVTRDGYSFNNILQSDVKGFWSHS